MDSTPLNIRSQETLPAEIVDLIIDNLCQQAHQKEARQALLSCSLVSKAFCVQAYSTLFEEIRISIAPTTAHSLWPHVLRKTREVFVTGLSFPALAMIYRIKKFYLEINIMASGNEFLSIANDPNFSGLLDALHGPRHGISGFELSISINSEPLPWWKLFPRFISAFHSLCDSVQLHTLKLAHFTMVPRDLLTGTNIKHLYLHDVIFGRNKFDVDIDTLEHPNICQLQTISFLDPWNFNTLFDLLALGYRCSPERYHRTAFANLESLTIGDRSPDQLLRILPSLRSLKHFGVTHSLEKIRRADHAVVDISQTLLGFIPGPSLLTLSIKIEVPQAIFAENGPDTILTHNPGWSALDSLLLEPQFDNVPEISLIVHFFTPLKEERPTDAGAFCTQREAILRRKLPGLIAVRSARFTLTVLLNRPEDSLKCIQRRGTATGWW